MLLSTVFGRALLWNQTLKGELLFSDRLMKGLQCGHT